MLTNTLRVSDGNTLAVFDWPVSDTKTRALIVHGLGEHARRYEPLSRWLNARGIAVRAYDQYGHGLSSGQRGHLATDMQLVDHLSEVFASLRGPVVLIGHSLGGLIAASAVARGVVKPDALLLSSPALAVPMQAWQRAAVTVLPRLFPNLTLGNGLQPKFLSHDPQVVADYVSDPLVHDRICARLGAFVAREGERVIEQATNWSVKTLLLYAGDDHLVDPRGSDTFAAHASGAVQAKRFAALYHEIFNEPNAEAVFRALEDWLDAAD